MSDVIRFKKKQPENPEVLTFKTDLKMFLNYLDIVDMQLSTNATTNFSDVTSNTFNGCYIRHLFDSIKQAFHEAYNRDYRSTRFINVTIFDTVNRYVEWSSHLSHPLFEFTLVTPNISMTVTTVMLTAEQAFITSITSNKDNLLSSLQTNLASMILINEEEGYPLSGGQTFTGEIDKQPANGSIVESSIRPTLFRYNFSGKEHIPAEIDENMTMDEFVEYLGEICYASEYILLPTEIEWMTFSHPLLEKPFTVFPSVSLVNPYVLPITELDRGFTITLYGRTEYFTLEWSDITEDWLPGTAADRPEISLLNHLESVLRNHDIRGAAWVLDLENPNDAHYEIITTFEGESYCVMWERYVDGGEPKIDVKIEQSGEVLDPRKFHYRMVEITTAIALALDDNTKEIGNKLTDIVTTP